MGLKVVLKVIQTCWDTIFEFTFPDFGAKIQIIFLLLNGYLLYGKRLKREICFRRNEILFYAEIQQKFTYLTSGASLIISSKKNITF